MDDRRLLLVHTHREIVALVKILRAERPQVVVTYDSDSGHGHPEHIQANRVTIGFGPHGWKHDLFAGLDVAG